MRGTRAAMPTITSSTRPPRARPSPQCACSCTGCSRRRRQSVHGSRCRSTAQSLVRQPAERGYSAALIPHAPRPRRPRAPAGVPADLALSLFGLTQPRPASAQRDRAATLPAGAAGDAGPGISQAAPPPPSAAPGPRFCEWPRGAQLIVPAGRARRGSWTADSAQPTLRPMMIVRVRGQRALASGAGKGNRSTFATRAWPPTQGNVSLRYCSGGAWSLHVVTLGPVSEGCQGVVRSLPARVASSPGGRHCSPRAVVRSAATRLARRARSPAAPTGSHRVARRATCSSTWSPRCASRCR